MSLKYAEINARAMNLLLSVKKHMPSIDNRLKAMVELRVSQINGCAYCIDLHSTEAGNCGVSHQKLECLSTARESGLFSLTENLALNWAESVTNISTETDIEPKMGVLLEHFTDTEVVDLTLIISVMNCLNRMSISFADQPTR